MSFTIESACFGRTANVYTIGGNDDVEPPVARLVCGNGRGAGAHIATGKLSLVFCLNGDMQLFTTGQSLILSEGHFWINTDQDIRINSIGDARWVVICCMGNAYLNLITEHYQLGLYHLTSLESMDEKAGSICKEIMKDSYFNVCTENTSQGIIDYLAEVVERNSERIWRSPGRTEKAKRLSFQRLMKARNKIAVDPGCINTIHDLAAQASYSEWHFIRLFARVFNETPMEYSQRLRLGRAKHMLISSKLSVSEIARNTGYETFSAFCRSFRNHYGITASAIRNNAA